MPGQTFHRYTSLNKQAHIIWSDSAQVHNHVLQTNQFREDHQIF